MVDPQLLAPLLLTHQPILQQALQSMHDPNVQVSTKATNQFCHTLDFYLELSTLLDPILPQLVTKTTSLLHSRLQPFLSQTPQSNPSPSQEHLLILPSQALYTLLKVRRPKNVLPYLPHQVSDLRYLLLAAEYVETHCHSHQFWQLRSVLFRNLSVAIRVPFPLHTITEPSSINSILSHSQHALSAPDPISHAAAGFLAHLVSRRDTTTQRTNLINWAAKSLSSSNPDTRITALLFLTATFKQAHRDDLSPHALLVLNSLIPSIETILATNIGNTTEAHLLVKALQRTALVLLPPRPAAWRYSRQIHRLRSSHQSISSNPDPDHDDQTSAQGIPPEAAEPLEVVLDALITGITHLQYYVRWSCAKGIGRLTARLPKQLARDVADSIVALLAEEELAQARPDASWQGACLAIAELARRGLLLPAEPPFQQALNAVQTAAQFDVRRGANTVGQNVRDAACYVVWSIARAYDAKHVAPFASCISGAMVPLALLDREVNCRRAASAALQECVGRLEEQVFKDGIRLITIADYFSLGNRTAAYLELAPKVAMLNNGEHFHALVNDLWKRKLVHWDHAIRLLAAQALAKLVLMDSQEMIVKQVIPDLVVTATKEEDMLHRHGAILGLAELIKVISQDRFQTVEEEIRRIPLFLVEKNVLTGRTGDEIRVACTWLIESIAANASQMFTKSTNAHNDAETILGFLEAILGCGKEEMYSHATTAYEAMCIHVISPNPEWHTRVTEKILDGISHSSYVQLQRGFALAAGACGISSISHRVAHVLSKELCTNRDVEVRRNSAVSLRRIPSAVYVDNWSEILQALLTGMNDYAIDERGDIGSWVREASLKSSAKVLDILLKKWDEGKEMTTKQSDKLIDIIRVVVEQCCSRINRTRKIAGDSLRDICSHVLLYPNASQLYRLCEQLASIFHFSASPAHTQKTSNDSTQDTDPVQSGRQENGEEENEKKLKTITFELKEEVFPAMQSALELPEICVPVIHGIVSAGGIVEYHSYVVYDVLVKYFKNLDNANKVKTQLEVILALIRTNNQRLTIPALRIIEILVKKGGFNKLEQSYLKEVSQVIRGSWRGRLRDVQRTKAAVRALTELACLSVVDDTFNFESGSLGYVCVEALSVVLGCTVPRLRRIAAESIYMTLIEFEVDEEELEDPDFLDEISLNAARAVAILSETEWEQVTLEAARERRNSICEYLSIQISRPMSVINNKRT